MKLNIGDQYRKSIKPKLILEKIYKINNLLVQAKKKERRHKFTYISF